MNTPIPLRPDYAAARRTAATLLIRAATAELLGYIERNSISRVAKQRWPHDRNTELLVRAAVEPASTATTAWAGTLAATAIADFILGLGPASAGAVLLQRGMQLSFDGSGAIVIPNLVAAASNATFVGEGGPIPARSFSIEGTTLSPKKFACISIFNREVFQHSIPNIERLVGATLAESAGLALDAALLDATAGDERPAGLRYSINALTESAETVRADAMAEDVATLAAGVTAIAGNAPIIFVAPPPQAIALKMWARRDFSFEILASSGLAANTVLAVASNALVSAVAPAPRLQASDQGTIHMDTSPLPIGTPGSPPTVAAPTTSLFQTDRIALRMVFDVAWGLRHVGGLAWVENVLW